MLIFRTSNKKLHLSYDCGFLLLSLTSAWETSPYKVRFEFSFSSSDMETGHMWSCQSGDGKSNQILTSDY